MCKMETTDLDSLKALIVDIEENNLHGDEVKHIFQCLSAKDFRDESEIKIDDYKKEVEELLEGFYDKACYRTVYNPMKITTGRGEDLYEKKQDYGYWCNRLLDSHYIKVQKIFWEKYKILWAQEKKVFAPSPKEIYEICIKIKNRKKLEKEKRSA